MERCKTGKSRDSKSIFGRVDLPGACCQIIFFLKAISQLVLECNHCNSVTFCFVMDKIHKHTFSFDYNMGLRQLKFLTGSLAEFHQLCEN